MSLSSQQQFCSRAFPKLFPLLGFRLFARRLGYLSCLPGTLLGSGDTRLSTASCLCEQGDECNRRSRCRVQRYPRGERIASMGKEEEGFMEDFLRETESELSVRNQVCP